MHNAGEIDACTARGPDERVRLCQLDNSSSFHDLYFKSQALLNGLIREETVNAEHAHMI